MNVVGWRTLIAGSTNNVFFPCEEWEDGGYVKEGRIEELEVAASSNAVVQAAFQVTNNPLSPPGAATFTLLGSAQTGDGVTGTGSWTDMTSQTGGNRFIRRGFVVRAVEAGTAWASARALWNHTRRC
jgi:hypothetical protein